MEQITDFNILSNKFNHLWNLIGNTPMLEIAYKYKSQHRKIYVKCEHYNLTGSIKDRMALYILQKAYEHELIKPTGIIGAAASGDTGGTIMGVGKYLQSRNPVIKIHPLEPAESPTLSTGYKAGSHRIQGISDEFIPAIVKIKSLDEVIKVSEGDSIIMAQ